MYKINVHNIIIWINFLYARIWIWKKKSPHYSIPLFCKRLVAKYVWFPVEPVENKLVKSEAWEMKQRFCKEVWELIWQHKNKEGFRRDSEEFNSLRVFLIFEIFKFLFLLTCIYQTQFLKRRYFKILKKRIYKCIITTLNLSPRSLWTVFCDWSAIVEWNWRNCCLTSSGFLALKIFPKGLFELW